MSFPVAHDEPPTPLGEPGSSTQTHATGLLVGRRETAAPPAPRVHTEQPAAAQPPASRTPRPIPRAFAHTPGAEHVWTRGAALAGCALVVVTSADGGTGRSTLTAALGGVLAAALPEPVLAIDGSGRCWSGLNDRVGGEHRGSIWDAARNPAAITNREHVRQWTRKDPSGLLALVAEPHATAERRPPRFAETAATLEPLGRLHAALLLDAPVAELGGVWHAFAAATAPVMVARATVDSLRHTLRLLDHMSACGLQDAVRHSVLTVLASHRSTPREVRAIGRQAAAVVGDVITVPFDPVLARPAPIDARRLARATRAALIQIAGAVLARCPTAVDPAASARSPRGSAQDETETA